MQYRIGNGHDIHRLVEGRKLVIGGVEIPYKCGLLGHSDADVLIHAIIDAFIGAVALGDIGKLFPDTDNKYKDADSRDLLRQVVAKVKCETDYSLSNLDATIIIQAPVLRGFIDSMRVNIAADIGVAIDQVNIKAKTSESIGIVGRGEAVIAEAVVLLIK